MSWAALALAVGWWGFYCLAQASFLIHFIAIWDFAGAVKDLCARISVQLNACQIVGLIEIATDIQLS